MTDPPPARRTSDLLSIAVLLVGTAAAYGLIRHSVPYSLDRNWAVAGFAGLVAGLLYWHRFRGLGTVPPALTVAAAAGVWAAFGDWSEVGAAVGAAALGIAFTRLTVYLDRFHRGTGWVGGSLLAAAFVFLLTAGLDNLNVVRPPKGGGSAPLPAVWFAGLTAALAVFAWWALFRPFVELASVPVLWLMFSVRGTGPGLNAMPAHGPCLVIGNHACWADPFLLAKVLPRPITPVMTSVFYDLPFISWMMRRVIKAIRVPEKALKQDVPQEIKEVIAALDRGECVVLFPEGYLRRSDDRPLRRFGRGVWQVLSARPDTPVFPCWIEGGWGSYTSYKNGLPTKNKRPDFRRRIEVAVDGPVGVEADVLAGHLVTRVDLMNRVAAARKWLGLPDLPAYELPAAGEEKDGAADDADRNADGRR